MTCKLHRDHTPGHCSYQRDENYTCLQSLNHCLLAEDMMMDVRDIKDGLADRLMVENRCLDGDVINTVETGG